MKRTVDSPAIGRTSGRIGVPELDLQEQTLYTKDVG